MALIASPSFQPQLWMELVQTEEETRNVSRLTAPGCGAETPLSSPKPPSPLPACEFRKRAGLTCELGEDGGTRERGPLYTEL